MGLLDGLKAMGVGVLDGIQSLGKNVASVGSQAISALGTGFTTVVTKGSDVVNTVITSGTSIINKGLDVGGGVINKVVDIGGGVLNKGVDIAGGAVNTFSLLPILAVGGGIYLLSHLITNAEPVGKAVSNSATALAPIISAAAI